MELPIQNLMNTSPALDKALSEGPGMSGNLELNKAEYDASFAAETTKAGSGPNGVQSAGRNDETGSSDFLSNGYAQSPAKSDARHSTDGYSSSVSQARSDQNGRTDFLAQNFQSRDTSDVPAAGYSVANRHDTTETPAAGYSVANRQDSSETPATGYSTANRQDSSEAPAASYSTTNRLDNSETPATGYSTTNRTGHDDNRSFASRELNIYQFNNEQASGQLRDPEAALLSNPGELVNQSFQSISYFIDRDLQTQNRLMNSQSHDVSSTFETNPFIVSGNNSATNISIPVSQDGGYEQQSASVQLDTSGNNNSATGKVDEQLRGLASYMGDVMLFSYQATLISKVSQSFSSSVSTLMRGQ